MLKDITIGQYYPAESIVHRLDPRVKLLGTLVFIISLFVNESPQGYIFAAVMLLVLIKISSVPIKFLLKGLKGIIFLLLFSIVFTVFLTDGEVIFRLGFVKITYEGVINAAIIFVRLVMLIMGSSIMTLTTTPTDIADGLEKSFRPLEIIKVPVHDIAMMMSIALRFIPILMEETDKIIRAQMARGADFETKGIIKKATAMIPLIVPLIVSSIRRALDLATAMEARCYRGGKGRTKLHPLKYLKRDIIAYFLLLAYLVTVFAIKILL
jgi:energy-coupling factor transport system permease protein